MMMPGFKSSEANQTSQRPIKKNQGMTIKKNQIKKYVYSFLFLI